MNCKDCRNTGCTAMGTDRIAKYCNSFIQTNADRIRAMTDEELAKHHVGLGCPPGTDVEELCKDGKCVPPQCYRCWLKWLKRVAE